MILILTPLPIELEALRSGLLKVFGGVLPTEFQLHKGGHGKVQFALTAQKLMFEFRPTLVVGVGAAGALDENLRPGDLVVAEAVIEHDYNLHFVKRPLPRFEADEGWLTKLREIADGRPNFAIQFGTIASGDEDIVDAERARELRALTDACAVTWESAGLARACKMQHVPFLEIRAITDSADKDAVADFQKNLAVGMQNVAAVLGSLFAD